MSRCVLVSPLVSISFFLSEKYSRARLLISPLPLSYRDWPYIVIHFFKRFAVHIFVDKSTSLLADSTLRTHKGGGGRGGVISTTLRTGGEGRRGGGVHCGCDRSHFHSVRHLPRNELYPLIQTVHVTHGFVSRDDLVKLSILNSVFPPLLEPSQASWTISKKWSFYFIQWMKTKLYSISSPFGYLKYNKFQVII